jgi:hypothetical protein
MIAWKGSFGRGPLGRVHWRRAHGGVTADGQVEGSTGGGPLEGVSRRGLAGCHIKGFHERGLLEKVPWMGSPGVNPMWGCSWRCTGAGQIVTCKGSLEGIQWVVPQRYICRGSSEGAAGEGPLMGTLRRDSSGGDQIEGGTIEGVIWRGSTRGRPLERFPWRGTCIGIPVEGALAGVR